jgi:hypothetical protein
MATLGTGRTIGAALTAALTEGRKAPRTQADVFKAYGSTPSEQNRALAREMAGLPASGPLPPRRPKPHLPKFPTPLERRVYERELLAGADRRTYDAAMRRVQRWRTTSTEKRKAPDLVREARTASAGSNLAVARAGGLHVRVRAEYRVSDKTRTATMPAGPPQYLGPEAVRRALDLWVKGSTAGAATALEAVFFGPEGYWDEAFDTTDEAFVGIIRAWVWIGEAHR